LSIRICHLITDLDTGGAERSLVNLILGSNAAQFRHEVVCLIEPGPMATPLAEAGIVVTTLGMRRGRWSLSGLSRLIHHLRATRPAILQTWLYHADLAGTIASWFAGNPKLLWNVRCSDMTHAPGETSLRLPVRALSLLSRCPDAIVVNSRRGRRDHEALGYRPKAWAEIPNGVDLARFRERRSERASLRALLGLDPDAVVIGLVARFHPMKDVATFLRAAALFTQKHAHVQFLLCGTGFDRDNNALTGMIADLGLGGRVMLLGRQPCAEDIYPTLDVFSLCSIYGEGFPNVLCEAMACGIPCVATDIGDSAEIVGDCGLIVPMRDPAALAQAWQKLLDLGPQAVGARARVAAKFSRERMCADYEALYRSITINQGAVPA